MLKTCIHFIVTLVCTAALVFAMCFFVLVWALAWLAKKIDPKVTRGNCWTYALPMFIENGGYLAVRAADGQRFLKVFMVPHVLYMPELPRRAKVSQYVPIDRKSSFWVPWHTLNYRGKVRHSESNHNAAFVYDTAESDD